MKKKVMDVNKKIKNKRYRIGKHRPKIQMSTTPKKWKSVCDKIPNFEIP